MATINIGIAQKSLAAGAAILAAALWGCAPTSPGAAASSPAQRPAQSAPAAPAASLGVFIREVEIDPAQSDGLSGGVRLELLLPGAAAAAAGLREGDVIFEFDRRPAGSTADFQTFLKSAHPGQVVAVAALRDAKRVDLKVTLDARPSDLNQAFAALLVKRIGAEQQAAAAARDGDPGGAFAHYTRAMRLLFLHNQYYRANVTEIWASDVAQLAALLPRLRSRPAVPTEADRHNRRAIAILKSAASDADNDRAANEFWAAIYEAPWIPDLYLNLGLTDAKAGHVEAAMAELRDYMELDPQAANDGELKQKLAGLEVLADDRKPWLPFVGQYGWSGGEITQIDLRDRKLIATIVTPSTAHAALWKAGDVIFYGTIRGREFVGKGINKASAEDTNHLKCYGAEYELEMEGAIDATGKAFATRFKDQTFQTASCAVTAEAWKPYETYHARN